MLGLLYMFALENYWHHLVVLPVRFRSLWCVRCTRRRSKVWCLLKSDRNWKTPSPPWKLRWLFVKMQISYGQGQNKHAKLIQIPRMFQKIWGSSSHLLQNIFPHLSFTSPSIHYIIHCRFTVYTTVTYVPKHLFFYSFIKQDDLCCFIYHD